MRRRSSIRRRCRRFPQSKNDVRSHPALHAVGIFGIAHRVVRFEIGLEPLAKVVAETARTVLAGRPIENHDRLRLCPLELGDHFGLVLFRQIARQVEFVAERIASPRHLVEQLALGKNDEAVRRRGLPADVVRNAGKPFRQLGARGKHEAGALDRNGLDRRIAHDPPDIRSDHQDAQGDAQEAPARFGEVGAGITASKDGLGEARRADDGEKEGRADVARVSDVEGSPVAENEAREPASREHRSDAVPPAQRGENQRRKGDPGGSAERLGRPGHRQTGPHENDEAHPEMIGFSYRDHTIILPGIRL